MSSSQTAMTVTILDSAVVENVIMHERHRLIMKKEPMSRLDSRLTEIGTKLG